MSARELLSHLEKTYTTNITRVSYTPPSHLKTNPQSLRPSIGTPLTFERSALRLRLTCDYILSADSVDLKGSHILRDCLGWGNVLVYTKRLILSGHHEAAANRILSALVSFTDYPISAGDQAIFDLFWKSASLPDPARPANTPWPAWDAMKLADTTRRSNPAQLAFYDWTTSLGNNTNDLDVRAWRESTNVPTIAICARMLCWRDPTSGRLPSREALIEAAKFWRDRPTCHRISALIRGTRTRSCIFRGTWRLLSPVCGPAGGSRRWGCDAKGQHDATRRRGSRVFNRAVQGAGGMIDARTTESPRVRDDCGIVPAVCGGGGTGTAEGFTGAFTGD